MKNKTKTAGRGAAAAICPTTPTATQDGESTVLTLHPHGDETPLARAYDRWETLLASGDATEAEIAAAKAAFRDAPADLPVTANLAYPIIEALDRLTYSFPPEEDWVSEIIMPDESFLVIPRVVDIEDITFLYLLEWHYDAFPNAEDLIADALVRSAFALGYVWSNDRQAFVEASCAD